MKRSLEDIINQGVPLALYHILLGHSISSTEQDDPYIHVIILSLFRFTDKESRPIYISYGYLVPRARASIQSGVKVIAFNKVVNNLVLRPSCNVRWRLDQPPAANSNIRLILADKEPHECVGDQDISYINNSITMLGKAETGP